MGDVRDTDREASPHDERERNLLASGRAERPPEGARGRAFDAATRVVAIGARPTTPAWVGPTRRIPRGVAWAVPALALVVGGLFLKQRLDARALEAAERRAAALVEQSKEQNLHLELSTPDESERAAIEQKLLEAEGRLKDLQATCAPRASGADAGAARGSKAGAGVGRTSSGSRRISACQCEPGDPLCSCL
jgi:hypothetical protein